MEISINFPYYNSEHSAQIITGFIENAHKFNLKLSFHYKPSLLNDFNDNRNILEVSLNHKRIIFDTDDGYNIPSLESFDESMDSVDFYFKRSYRSSYHENLKNKRKLYPLGLNYYVTCKHNPLNNPGWGALTIKESTKKLLRHIPNTNVSYSNFYNERYEKLAETPPLKDQILFITRLWDSHDAVNTMRINCVQALRDTFKDVSLICGFVNSPLAQKLCPELILEPYITKKNNYLDLVQTSTICVTTTGLYDSIGWKFAEYVAAGKAIVSETLLYELPGNFKESENYFSFYDSKTCVESIQKVLNSSSLKQKMFDLNTAYFHSYVKPKSMIANALNIILAKEI